MTYEQLRLEIQCIDNTGAKRARRKRLQTLLIDIGACAGGCEAALADTCRVRDVWGTLNQPSFMYWWVKKLGMLRCNNNGDAFWQSREGRALIVLDRICQALPGYGRDTKAYRTLYCRIFRNVFDFLGVAR